jgi:hypothetical protein
MRRRALRNVRVLDSVNRRAAAAMAALYRRGADNAAISDMCIVIGIRAFFIITAFFFTTAFFTSNNSAAKTAVVHRISYVEGRLLDTGQEELLRSLQQWNYGGRNVKKEILG